MLFLFFFHARAVAEGTVRECRPGKRIALLTQRESEIIADSRHTAGGGEL